MSPLPPLILQRPLFLLPTLALFTLASAAAYVVGGNQTEALLQWKSSLDAQSRVRLSSWNESVSPCQWVGITCDAAGGNIVNLSLSSSSLNGTLHNLDFSSFPDLTTLDLHNNSLFGKIPSSIGNLSKLYYLELSQNQLVGTIPSSIAHLRNLSFFSLALNSLSGTIPEEIGYLSSLELLFLHRNALSGPIPREIGKLSNLNQLDVSNNNLSGSIPTTIGNVTHLAFLYLYGNSLSGPIPEEIGQTDLIHLQLHVNYLTGSIPTSVGNLSRLTSLMFNENSLTGSIPASVGKLISLNTLNLNDNRLSGQIPHEIGMLSSIKVVSLYDNQLIGSIPPSLGNLTSLEILYLLNNELSGPIPREIGNLRSLSDLFLRNNRLSGIVPPQLGNLRELSNLQLSNNSFTGQWPSEICDNALKIKIIGISYNFLVGPISLKNCSRLSRARFEYNQLTGHLSDVFGVHPQLDFVSLNNNKFFGKLSMMNSTHFPNLTSFDISKNNLSGTIPPELGDLMKLQRLNLSANNLIGEVPGTLGKLSSLINLLLDGNRLSGYVPSSIGLIPTLQELNVANNNLNGLSLNQTGLYSNLLFLNLSSNNLEGNFPIEVCNFRSLQSVDLSQNSLVGSIPKQIDQLQRLEALNISHNKLSGSISSLRDLPSLVTVDVSYNQLEGPIPNVPAFHNVTFDVLRNNTALCSKIFVGLHSCPPSVEASRHKKGSKKTWLVVLLPSFAGFLLIVFLVIVYIHSKRKMDIILEPQVINNHRNLFEIWSYDGRFLYENIIEATEEFNSKYCIGVGAFASVYKANLSTGQVVALKKPHIALGDETIRDKSFDSEIRALLEIRHRNIVKLYGFCSTPRISFIVYEYLASGSLHSLLDNDGEVTRFGWLERVNVVKGIADALSYMHHDCSPPIVHRDISSKNILLDENYEAHVSDFGTARFLKPDSSNWTSFAGTFGYAAPELAYVIKPNEKCDVYSFGIITLEILLGKHPANVVSLEMSSFLEAITAIDAPIKGVLDNRIPCPEKKVAEVVISVLKMALSCLNYPPKSRPSMKGVSQGLASEGGSMVPNLSVEMKMEQIVY